MFLEKKKEIGFGGWGEINQIFENLFLKQVILEFSIFVEKI